MTRTNLALSVLTLLAAGCQAAGGPSIGDDMADAEDGFRFVRPVNAQSVELGQESIAVFDNDEYIAYEFEVAEASTIRIKTSPDFWSGVLDQLDLIPEYGVQPMLFAVDESAPASSPEARYDFVTTRTGLEDVWKVTFPVLEYDVLRPGRYMVLLLGRHDNYDDALEVETSIEALAPLAERAPGSVTLRLFSLNGTPGANVRVAIGSSAGVTDLHGAVHLDDVAPGEQTVLVGPEGLGRLDGDCYRVNVAGDGLEDGYLCTAVAADIEKWQEPASAP